MNWDNARYFLALARAGSLRAAAAQLEVDQATVGRRLQAFESELGSRLFLRTPQGYQLSESGRMLLADAERMESSADAFCRKAAESDRQLAGPVRIAATETVAQAFVLPALAQLSQRQPELEFTLLTGLSLSDVAAGEVDFAIRSRRPDKGELLVRKLATIEMSLYASRGYLARRGRPQAGESFAGHDLLMLRREAVPRHWQNLCGESIDQARIALQANSQFSLRQAALNGMGIAMLSCFIADGDAELERVWPERVDHVDMWMVLHPDVQKVTRVRAAVEAIAAAFQALG
ncbi:LysR family transcriptional regulator [Chromobacterium sp. IIBBL 290-4]|uniref:LysR family transcriptional regulator n=1 Tax=Chromobacterium sp. IIBBL 290-4 TaxID=2953890 RepID=UPI0020B6BA3B|nr:LysR family transcriptional regulator [Chromobacterium sp. IIBBL 290-4]UTH75356.1 LysR family transcriptional regulator [Chromobacterium sp. IIBBL 290-4]